MLQALDVGLGAWHKCGIVSGAAFGRLFKAVATVEAGV